MTVKEFLIKLLPYMNRDTSFYQFRPTVNSKKFTDAVSKIAKASTTYNLVTYSSPGYEYEVYPDCSVITAEQARIIQAKISEVENWGKDNLPETEVSLNISVDEEVKYVLPKEFAEAEMDVIEWFKSLEIPLEFLRGIEPLKSILKPLMKTQTVEKIRKVEVKEWVWK